jgi:hypothetical protein
MRATIGTGLGKVCSGMRAPVSLRMRWPAELSHRLLLAAVCFPRVHEANIEHVFALGKSEPKHLGFLGHSAAGSGTGDLPARVGDFVRARERRLWRENHDTA